MTLRMAAAHGLKIDNAVRTAVEDRTFHELRSDDALDRTIQVTTLNDPTPNDSLLLMAAAAAGLERNLTMEVRAQQLLGWQQEDGRWATSDFRPPHSSSAFTATATAVRAIHFYAPDELRPRTQTAFKAAQQWLRKTQPVSTEDAAFRLMGLVWAGADPNDVSAARNVLLAMQRPDGGWPQLRSYESDAYSTGESLFALKESGAATESAAFQRGATFLETTQAADGTWRVHTRMLSPADVSPPYFDTGFPYAKDSFLSYAGTSWAVMGLLSSLPESAPVPLRAAKDPPESPERWIRTALFGTAGALKQLLDGGLSANSKTAGGTTILMMAAPDAEKVRLLIGSGATVQARTASGTDALTIAAAQRGTAGSVRAMLDALASPQAPAGVHVHRNPLEFAAMTGDIANVKLLISRGADPDAGALSEAITFGHEKVVETLLHFGADPGLTEPNGINLLHWATITNRAAVIPLLVKAHVPLNDADNAGYTPLMYAATLDFGDTRTLDALLRAGASPQVKNKEGRNATEQARYFKHTAIESVLIRRQP